MKAAAFDFAYAKTLDQALNVLSDPQADCKIMGGSQSLGPMLNLRLARPAQIIDVSGLDELRQVHCENGYLRIGACITHAEIEDGVYAPLAHHPWRKVAANIAYRAVRNRGTIGGSIAHADPAADWVLAASAVNARIDIATKPDRSNMKHSTRSVDMSEFMLAAYTTVLKSSEIITAITIPEMPETSKWGYYKFCRKIGEFAESSCAAYFDPVNRVANVVIGALDGAPRHLASLATTIAKDGWQGSTHPNAKERIRKVLEDALPERDMLDLNMYATTVMRCLDRAFDIRESA